MTKEQFDLIDEIAQYIIPNWRFENEQYVKLETVVYLRDLARKAIALEKEKVKNAKSPNKSPAK